jgi:hypothetical protein
MTMRSATLTLALILLAAIASADETPASGDGRVQIPLDVYQQLVEAAQQPQRAPSGFAVGKAELDVQVHEAEGRASGEVRVVLSLEVLEDRWVLVPILPSGTPVSSVTINGSPVQLINTPSGLAWGSNQKGSYSMELRYEVDATRSQAGYVLPLPTPAAAATKLSASLPGAGLDVAMIPSAGVKTKSSGGRTQLTATVPATRGVQISWRAPSLQSHTISRALYSGELSGDAVHWSAELSVELASNETVTLELLPRTVTLNDIEVDGAKAAILVEGQSFATRVKGRGAHTLTMEFQVPVQRSEGPPQVSLQIPEIPVSRFELSLPGRKEVSVQPASDVAHRSVAKSTVASFHVPMTRHVQLSWTAAIPEDLRTETRANASLYHAVHAEEGVLFVDATVVVDVTRGELGTVELELPGNVQVNRIHSDAGGISDWRVSPADGGETQTVTVFLGHGLVGEMSFRVHYDRSLGSGDADTRIPIPLLRAKDVHRQRGMVALLATKEVALTPAAEDNLTRVGENQLPAFFRQTIERTIAHTYKYAESVPVLVAKTTTPERVLAKFDAQVNTLISLTDVTMKGSASVNINVKGGKLNELQLQLPPGVNLLNLTAPSLRGHRVSAEQAGDFVDVEFTQDMEGQFRVEVAYERITADAESEVSVPTLRVPGAEVEQGRIAVEALAAVEVQVASAEQLSTLDPGELPQQLILKTTNPILLGYKYVHTDPPYDLRLRMTRHKEVDVQTAAIDEAHYRTLFTRDGLAVTTARLMVRNSRKQFLRVRLPGGAELWSASVDGTPEKPAISNNGNGNGSGHGPPEILIKVINSVAGFPVELIYATPVNEMGRFGRVSAQLPRPDMVVTRSHWDLYLPAQYRYGKPTTNMDLVSDGTAVSRDQLDAEMSVASRANATPQLAPLHIEVPTSGMHFSFEKLYANQSEEDAAFSMPYTSRLGATLGQTLALLGTALFWAGIAIAVRRKGPIDERQALALAAVGAILLLLPITYLQTSATPPVVLSVLLVMGGAAFYGRDWLARTTEEVSGAP